MILLSNARRGASGKAATKMVVKPNCKTRQAFQWLEIGNAKDLLT